MAFGTRREEHLRCPYPYGRDESAHHSLLHLVLPLRGLAPSLSYDIHTIHLPMVPIAWLRISYAGCLRF